MPKEPPARRPTTNPLGQKIQQVMEDRFGAPDCKRLAEAFGVKTPSVYDWIDHGRIGKHQLKLLAEWSGRSLDWWFDVDRNKVQLMPLSANESQGRYDVSPDWPLGPRISAAVLAELPEPQRERIRGYIEGVLDEWRYSQRPGGPATQKPKLNNGTQ